MFICTAVETSGEAFGFSFRECVNVFFIFAFIPTLVYCANVHGVWIRGYPLGLEARWWTSYREKACPSFVEEVHGLHHFSDCSYCFKVSIYVSARSLSFSDNLISDFGIYILFQNVYDMRMTESCILKVLGKEIDIVAWSSVSLFELPKLLPGAIWSCCWMVLFYYVHFKFRPSVSQPFSSLWAEKVPAFCFIWRVLLLLRHRTLGGWLAGWCLAKSSSLTTIPQSGWCLHWSCPDQQTLLLSWKSHWAVMNPGLLVLVGLG